MIQTGALVVWGSNGEVYAHEMAESGRKSTVSMALKDIADAQGDVDGYIALYDTKTRTAPGIAADIAARRLAALRGALVSGGPAGTLALRAMITFALARARSNRYRHAARHLLECESLAAQIEDFGGHPDHEAFLAALKLAHGRKASFWQRVED